MAVYIDRLIDQSVSVLARGVQHRQTERIRPSKNPPASWRRQRRTVAAAVPASVSTPDRMIFCGYRSFEVSSGGTVHVGVVDDDEEPPRIVWH